MIKDQDHICSENLTVKMDMNVSMWIFNWISCSDSRYDSCDNVINVYISTQHETNSYQQNFALETSAAFYSNHCNLW